MAEVTKITISLDSALLEAVERRRRAKGQTRSEFFCYAVEQVLYREQEEIERYIQGYREQPETGDAVLIARQIGLAVLSQEPWE